MQANLSHATSIAPAIAPATDLSAIFTPKEVWWQGTDGNDVFQGKGTNDVVWGGKGDDVIYGDVNQTGDLASPNTTSNDRLHGQEGRDTLYGGNGNDQLFGGADDDVLVGGRGSDTMTGGTGRDVFQFTDVSDFEPGKADLITDFEKGSDKIDISQLDAKIGTPANDAFHMVDYDPNHVLQAGEMTSYYDKASGHTVVLMEAGFTGNGADYRIELEGDVHLTQSDFVA